MDGRLITSISTVTVGDRLFSPVYFPRSGNNIKSVEFLDRSQNREHAGDAKKVNLLIKRNRVYLFWRSYQAGNILSIGLAFGTDVPDRPSQGTEAKTEPPSPIDQKISQNLAFFFHPPFQMGVTFFRWVSTDTMFYLQKVCYI